MNAVASQSPDTQPDRFPQEAWRREQEQTRGGPNGRGPHVVGNKVVEIDRLHFGPAKASGWSPPRSLGRIAHRPQNLSGSSVIGMLSNHEVASAHGDVFSFLLAL